MSEIPTWWLIVSAVFFVVNLLMFAALGIAAWKIGTVIKSLQPKLHDTMDKVNGLTIQVTEIGHKVSEIAENVNRQVNEVGGRAKGVVGSAELVAQSASRQFERFSPFIIGATSAMRLIKTLADMRSGRSEKKRRRGILSLFGKSR